MIENGDMENGLEMWSAVDMKSHGSKGVGLIMNKRAKQHVKKC